jgi:hypothetical protein
MPQLSTQELDSLRRSLRSEHSRVSDEALEQIVESVTSELSPGAGEDFMKALGSIGKTVGPTLQRAAPSVAQGAATGATVGGPWGALIGAGAGLASGMLSGRGKPTAPPPAAAPGSAPPPPGAAAPSEPSPLPTGQGAAATLLGLMQNPTVQQALMSQVLGASGSQQIPTASGASIPRGAINGLLTQLLANASEALVESESISEQSYLLGESGEFLIDPASLEQQAALVLSRLGFVRPGSRPSDSVELAETLESIEAAEWMSEDADWESDEWLESEDSSETVRFY